MEEWDTNPEGLQEMLEELKMKPSTWVLLPIDTRRAMWKNMHGYGTSNGEDEEEDEEEEDDDDEEDNDTTETCVRCGDAVQYDTECIRIDLMRIDAEGGNLRIDYARTGDGKILCGSVFAELECFEAAIANAKEAIRDELPRVVRPEHQRSGLNCCVCGKSIELGDRVAQCWLVELHRPERMAISTADGEVLEVADVERIGRKADTICIGCLESLSDTGELEAWGAEAYGEDICPSCLSQRCWRFGICACRCHE